MKKMFIFFLTLIFTSILYADDVKIDIYPKNPSLSETFQVYFRIFTSESDEPEITFKKMNLEVLGKSNQGISTRTIYANGKLSVSRELTIVYELEAPKKGLASLSEILVKVGKSEIRHPAITFTIQESVEKNIDIFLKADVPKKELYIGEGILVRYYLYSKIPVRNLDIKKYPKLSNFLKRFLNEAERTERVSVDGSLYMRTQLYAVKLYPEKTGRLIIDPLKISLSFAESDSMDPFDAFGLSSRSYRKRKFQSDKVEIKVKPIPGPIPDHFTGLVGTHDFQLTVGKNKLIVNEPFEFKLTVSGGGALENMETPLLFQEQSFESFETNGDLKIVDPNKAVKEFNYTYLAKNNANISAKELTLSYFDPDRQIFVEKKINFPQVVVAGEGVARQSDSTPQKKMTPNPDHQSSESFSKSDEIIVSPLSRVDVFWDYYLGKILKILNLALILLLLFYFLSFFLRSFVTGSFFHKTYIPSSFKRNHFDLTVFLAWISPLLMKTSQTPSEIIEGLNLSTEAKDYFLKILKDYQEDKFSQNKNQTQNESKPKKNFRYKAKYFKEFSRCLNSLKNDV